ncbi:MAG: HisA/HisF-related TIM barrel protein [Planctomycetota bacterium]
MLADSVVGVIDLQDGRPVRPPDTTSLDLPANNLPSSSIPDALLDPVKSLAQRRTAYNPFRLPGESTACSGIDLLRHFRDLQLRHIYIADLDRIGGQWNREHDAIISVALEQFDRVFVDAGISDGSLASFQRLRHHAECSPCMAGQLVPILSSESAANAPLVNRWGEQLGVPLAASVDLLGDQLLLGSSRSPSPPDQWADEMRTAGLRDFFVISLQRVGTAEGLSVPVNMVRWASQHDDIRIHVGGGANTLGDVRRALENGVHQVMLGRMLHDMNGDD